MSSRFEREQIRLRKEILDTALHLAETKGWSAVSIRSIANKIEYSTTKVYELFKNKDHIILELLKNGFDLLATQLVESTQFVEDPEERAIALAKGYCHFAWENGAYYRIMYGMDGVPFGVKETWREGMRIGEISKEVLAPLFPKCEEHELVRHVYALWGTLHGITSLFMAGRIHGNKKQAEELVLQALLTMTRNANKE